MTKTIMALIIAAISFPVFSKDSLTGNFVSGIESSIESNGEISSSIDIVCPAQSASGKLLITHVSYEYGKSKGVFLFKSNDQPQAPMTAVVPLRPNDDFDSPIINGWEFSFKMPKGQFFVTVFKSGKVKVGVNKNGTTGVKEINCKAVKPE
ncbi:MULTISPECIES: hypothetical protein [Serratia]|uniref:hypothetical protein n=1 Tax=Serratia TaxID=613 RepID=UPI0009495328|nr:hypothetical protein [Serratia sp. 506_PEND]